MTTIGKRIAALCGAMWLLVSAGGMAVSAEDTVMQKTLIVSLTEDRLQLEPSSKTAAIWEYPALSCGETSPVGTLTLQNTTAYATQITLQEVHLPYTNTEELVYLNSVQITVRDGEHTLYEGTYAHIADAEGGLRMEQTLQAGESKEYTIMVRRAFRGGKDQKPIVAWDFSVTSQVERSKGGVLTWAASGVFGVGAVTMLILLLRKLRHKGK